MKFFEKFLGTKLKENERAFNKIKLFEILLSLLFILIGIIMILNKTINDSTVGCLLGVLILLEGALNIYSTIMSNSNDLFKANIVFGVLYIIVSILLFTNIIKFLNFLQIYYGAYLTISGVKLIIRAIKLRMIKDESFLIIGAMSLLTIALGLLIIFYPFQSFGVIEIVAIFSILFGILNINNANLMKNRVVKILSKVDSN